MRYLGELYGADTLSLGDEPVARADCDPKGLLSRSDQIICSAEKRMSGKFAEKRLGLDSHAVQVAVAGELSSAPQWRH